MQRHPTWPARIGRWSWDFGQRMPILSSSCGPLAHHSMGKRSCSACHQNVTLHWSIIRRSVDHLWSAIVYFLTSMLFASETLPLKPFTVHWSFSSRPYVFGGASDRETLRSAKIVWVQLRGAVPQPNVVRFFGFCTFHFFTQNRWFEAPVSAYTVYLLSDLAV